MKSLWTEKATRWLGGTIACLLAANLLVSLQAHERRAVAAPLPDSGAQLERVVEELVKLNKSSAKIEALLESGKLVVKVEKAEK